MISFLFTVVRKKKLLPKQQKKQQKFSALKKIPKRVSLIDDKADWNGTLFPFKGTLELYGEKVEKSDSDFDDSEWLEEPNKKPGENLKFSNALGDLMSAYNSDDDLKDEVPSKQQEKDDDAPLEVKINREPDNVMVQSNHPVDQQQRIPSKNKRKRKKMKTDCQSDAQDEKTKTEVPLVNNKKSFIDQPFKKRRVTLLERLLDSEIRHERNVLLQCVRFVVENDYFS